MQYRLNRGGAKPRMLPPSATELPITIGNGRKFGIYELSVCGDVLARRVELPEWLSEAFLNGRFDLRTIRMPKHEIGESRGHIFISPPRELFSEPAVGLDVEIFEAMVRSKTIQSINFYIYATGYRLVEVWTISKERFVAHAKRVQTKPQFMPQMMVGLSMLSRRADKTLH